MRAAAERLDGVLRQLDPFLGVDADVDLRRVQRIYALPGRLRRQASALADAAGPADPRPLREWAPAVAAAGWSVHQRSRRLEALLDWHAGCAPRELAAFLSALEALALEGDPAPERGPTPRLDYAFFDGRLPGLVPEAGGWLVAAGAGLQGERATRVALRGERDESIAQLEPHPAPGGDAIAVWLAPALLAERRGSCLSLRVVPDSADAESAALSLPLCVPESSLSRLRLTGELSYRTETATRVLESDEIRFVNASCRERRSVSQTLAWTLEPDARLVDMGRLAISESGEASIGCRIDAGRITCSGWLGPAACDENAEPRVETEWHSVFSPTQERPDPGEHTSAALGEPVEAPGPTTELCVSLPRAAASETTRMRFELLAVNAHQQRSVFSSPVETLKETLRRSYDLAPHRLEAELDPAREPGKAAVCVTLRSPRCPS